MPESLEKRLVLGVDIGGTKTLVGLIDPAGRVVSYTRTMTPASDGPDAILDRVAHLATELVQSSTHPALACGVGSAGTVDADGMVVASTTHLRDWAGTDLVGGLRKRLGLPTVALNDVHAAALGESWAGGSGGAGRMLYVAAGTGIGGAIVTDGRLLRGAHGAAGSIGHMATNLEVGRLCSCGAIDHVEAFASGPGIELSYRETTGTDGRVPLREIGLRAINGEAAAASAITDAASLLGAALADAVCLVDCESVVLGGGVLGLGEIFVDPLRRRVGQRLRTQHLEPRVSVVSLGNDAAMVGSGLLAHRLLGGEPSETAFV
jgi:glucokinase